VSALTQAGLAEIAAASVRTVSTRPLPEIQARFAERMLLDGAQMDADITGRLLSATMTRGYDQATSLELELDDHDLRILTSGLISRKGKVRQEQFDQADWARYGDARLVLDGVAFRLAGVSTNYGPGANKITLTFEDELATLMRHKKGPRRYRRQRSRNDHFGYTRAEAIESLINDSVGSTIAYLTPALSRFEPVKGQDAKAKRKERQKGLAHWRRLRMQNVTITPAQKRNVEIALGVADDLQAGDRATIAMLCAGIAESDFIDQMNHEGSGYGGVFQGAVAVPGTPNWFAGMSAPTRTKEQATSFLQGGRGYQGGGAIKLAAANPNMGPGEIALTVEGSLANFPSKAVGIGFYGQWATEAQTILDAWGGVGRVKIVEHSFSFVVGKGETYFDAAARFAKEVNWRFWIDSNEIWYAPDDWLFQSATTLEITPDTQGLRGFSSVEDVGIPIGEIVIEANVARWVGSPAWRVELDGMGALNGLWLLALHQQDLFTEDSTITLHRPAPKLKEPAPPKTKIIRTETRPESGSTRDKILQACALAFKQRSKYVYARGTHARPMPTSLFGPAPRYLDCSSFATLVYKAGGAPDPNGRGYDGQGYTGTLWANGQRTRDPQPGDLAFYGDPAALNSHVNVYAGDNTFYNMGPSAGLSHPTGLVRSDFIGYRTYGLD
jgi:hypothetical protein